MGKIAIVGSPGSGKTVLLTVLTSLKGKTLQIVPNTKETHLFMKNGQNLLNGEWCDKTLVPTELSWDVTYNMSQFTLQTNDFPGESWNEFIGKYGDKGVNDASLKRKLENYISDTPPKNQKNTADILENLIAESDIILVLLDLTQIINKLPGWEAQEWIPFAIRNYLLDRKRSLKSMAVVLTKCDQLDSCPEVMNDSKNGYWQLIRKYAPLCENLFGKVYFLMVAAVANTVWDNNINNWVPAHDFSSKGLMEVLDWIVSTIKARNIERIRKILISILEVIVIFIVSVWLVQYPFDGEKGPILFTASIISIFFLFFKFLIISNL